MSGASSTGVAAVPGQPGHRIRPRIRHRIRPRIRTRQLRKPGTTAIRVPDGGISPNPRKFPAPYGASATVSVHPEVVEAIRSELSTEGGVLDILVSQLVLDGAGDRAVVGEFEASRMAERVGWIGMPGLVGMPGLATSPAPSRSSRRPSAAGARRQRRRLFRGSRAALCGERVVLAHAPARLTVCSEFSRIERPGRTDRPPYAQRRRDAPAGESDCAKNRMGR